MNIIERFRKPTPKFFRILRNMGVVLATIGGAIIAAPLTLPSLLVTISTYLTIAGTVASAISQLVVEKDEISINRKTK